ncbi:MAG TPA: hypothetical protein QF564_07270 [Pirellulaceae bacterium]|nr:hypothetical protein [Pirellulaceae bacterium]
MDVQTLINSLSAGGFRVLAHGDEGVAITPAVGLSDGQRQAIREHKTTLRHLVCIPDAYEHAEREAIQFADKPEADEALIRARLELKEMICRVQPTRPPSNPEWTCPSNGLVGNGFPPHPTEQPPASIIDTSVYCSCGNKLLPELRSITGEVCWACHQQQGATA